MTKPLPPPFRASAQKEGVLNVVANQALNIEYGGNNRLWSDVSTQEDARVWALSAWLDNIGMKHFRKGFTLLELLISVGILALIGTLSLVSFINSRNIRDLVTSGQNILSVLREAQSRTLAREDNSVWGTRLEQNRFILFRGSSFAASTSTQTYNLPSGIEIVNINLSGGGQEITFGRLDGRTLQTGSFEVKIRGGTQTFSISVDSSGKVYQTGSAPAVTGSRIVDARHRNFNLGWTIRGSITLLLTFSDPPNPDIPHPIVITPAPPRNSFDWSGTITVGGQNQVLRIHTATSSDTNTILSVDRDCRRNTKKVKISIDTRDIATYEADCQTVTVGPFGGAMTEP